MTKQKKILKFGGSSISDPARIKHVVKIIQQVLQIAKQLISL